MQSVPTPTLYGVRTTCEPFHEEKSCTYADQYHRFQVSCTYTPETITSAAGSVSCYNCTMKIKDRIYFYPTRVDNFQSFMMAPIPHCRPACALRTIVDKRPTYNELSLFFAFYGPDVKCAPPRSLLYIPNGGMSLEEYHQEKRVIHQHDPNVKISFEDMTFTAHKKDDNTTAKVKQSRVKGIEPISTPTLSTFTIHKV